MKKLLIVLGLALISMPNLLMAQGCSAPSSDEGVTLWGYLQPEFNANFAEETEASFRFRRMRIGLMGNIPYDFGYYVLMETSQFMNPDQTGPFLLDAFVSYNRYQYLKVALGSFKYSFGRELSMPCHGLYTINRSQMVDELTANLSGGNRDIGIMLLGGNDTTKITYSASLTNGTGTFETENNLLDTYAVNGRLTYQPIKGLYFGASGRYMKSPPQADGVEDDDTKFRLGFDAQYSFNNFTLLGEYIKGNDEGSYLEGGGCGGDPVLMTGTNNADGFSATVVYRTNSNLEPVYKIENYGTVKGDGTDNPINVEESSMRQTFGLNYYPNDWTRLQLNYIYKAEKPTEVKNDMLLLQFQVRF